MRGPIALVGGGEFLPPAASLDAWLLDRSGSRVVTVLPTAAREHPEMAVATARHHFRGLGADVDGAMILTRSHAEDLGSRAALAGARFLYLAGGDPRYLLSVLVGTPAWEGVIDALDAGAVVAGSSAGAMVLCEWMLVPGSSRLDRALGLLPDLVVLPHHNRWSDRLPERLEGMARAEVPALVGIDEATGLVLEATGGCRVLGAGSVTLYRAGSPGSGGAVPGVVWTREAPAELDVCP